MNTEYFIMLKQNTKKYFFKENAKINDERELGEERIPKIGDILFYEDISNQEHNPFSSKIENETVAAFMRVENVYPSTQRKIVVVERKYFIDERD